MKKERTLLLKSEAWNRFWLVDPLDGTKEFIKRNGEFTVNIAMVEEGLATFGVVFAPVLDELYLGIPGRGAFRCRKQKNFNQALDYLLQFADKLPIEELLQTLFKVVASRSHYNRGNEELCGIAGYRRTRDQPGE